MDAKYEVMSQTVEVLLSPGTIQFEIPPFQRRFSWGQDEIEQLFDDVFSETSRTDLPYFLGSIVLASKDGGGGGEPLLVLDGQQRLTTLSLTIAVLISKLKLCGLEGASEHNMYLYSRKLKGQKKPKIFLQGDDAKIFESIIADAGNAKDAKYSHSSLGVAARKISDLLEKYKPKYGDGNDADAYEGMLERILYDLEIVRIKAPSEKDAFRLFETLNDRGLALSAADLIKNKLFSHCGAEIDDAFEAWSNMISLTGEDEVVSYLRYFWIARKGFTRKRGLYDSYKDFINKLDSTSATLFAIELEESAKDYAQVVKPNQRTCSWGSDVADCLDRINVYRARSYRPVILAASHYHPSILGELAEMCESISVRFSVVGEKNPNELEKMYAEISKILREEKDEPLKVIADSGWLKNVPSDEEFSNKLESMDIVSVTPAWRQVLVRLNSAVSTGETRVESASKVHVEHVLPQSPRATALIESGMTKEDAEALVNRVGNLTLLSGRRNQSISNKPFSMKKEEFEKSEIALTKHLALLERWDASAINERSKWMADLAVSVYPHPIVIASR